MRARSFRKFFEGITAGGATFDTPAMNTHSLGHQPEMPDRVMSLGTDEIQGEVISLQIGSQKATLQIKKDDGKVTPIVTTPDSLHHHGKELPKRGDQIRVVLGDDGNIQDYEVISSGESGY